jgi:cellulose synthase/poly-beta-1,6-N-acetylglucosamine synthase-like glycosyltransferase
LDNQSQTEDLQWLREHFPEVKAVLARTNDYLFSYNELLNQLQEEIVILLNSDLRLDPHFIRPLVRHFQREDLFAVSALSYDWEGKVITSGCASFMMHHGWFYTEYDSRCQEASYTLFPTGGFAAVNRQKFLQLGVWIKV